MVTEVKTQQGIKNKLRRAWIFIALLIPVLLLIFTVTHLTVNVPFWDDYDAIVKFLTFPASERISHLFDPHNEHRIATARLVFDGIARLTGKFNFQVCIAVGDTLLLLMIGVFCREFVRKFGENGWYYFIPFAWLLVSLFNYENLCWALCAVSNQSHLLLALLALCLFRNRRNIWCYIASLLCGILCTFAIGSGMLVWGALIGMLCAEYWKEWTMQPSAIPVHPQKSTARKILHIFFLITAAALSIFVYLRGFQRPPSNTDSPNILNMILFFLAFLGNLVPFYPAALAIGCTLAIILLFLFYRFPKADSDTHPVFFFLIYLLGCMGAAAVFRSETPSAANAFRYSIISTCTFTCIIFLLIQLIPVEKRIAQIMFRVLLYGCVAFTLATYILIAPRIQERNETLRRNLLTWPTHAEGLRYPEPETASRLLSEFEKTGLYDHRSVAKPGELPPDAPLPWPTR